MEGNSTTSMTTNTLQTSINPPISKPKNKTISLFFFFATLAIFATIFSITKPISSDQETGLNPVIKTACNATLYPSLCLDTLSLSSPSTTTTLHHVLEYSIKQTTTLVSASQSEIVTYFGHQQLTLQETNALNDCLGLLDQTLYELGQSIHELRASPRLSDYPYSNLKTLLSAAMTNENTCIDGFLDLSKVEKFDSKKEKGLLHKIFLELKLNPIVHMISNSLAIIKQMELSSTQEPPDHIKKPLHGPKTGVFPAWMSKKERRLMAKRKYKIRPNVVVAKDGSGDYKTIGEALEMAPNMSMSRFVIKIKKGVYHENLEVARNKMNIMLMGEGMNSTLITGSRSLVDGFSTFASATLTVIGDRFLARDLTIENTATPEQYQAVAARVTSNSAFFRCNFTSNQDTLYAHSLRQFYRECVIEGTIDFIFGNAAAVFHKCYILARPPIPGQSNMITAQSREDPNQNTGFSIQNCAIQAAPDFTFKDRRRTCTFLGRPWRNFSRTIITKSYIGDLIHPLGWSEWDEYSNLDTIEYIEYMNFGPGSDTKDRVKWKGYKNNCSEDTVKRFTVAAFLNGPDDWLDTTGFSL